MTLLLLLEFVEKEETKYICKFFNQTWAILFNDYKKSDAKYKGKIGKNDISVFVPEHNYVGYLRWLASFGTHIDIHTYGVFQSTTHAIKSYMSFMIYMTYMSSVIWHAYILQYGCQKKH